MREYPLLDPASTPLEGTTLIEASAGTGKTHTLTTLFLRLLLEKRLRVDQILVVTFTEAATEELRGRIGQRLRRAVDLAREDNPVLTDADRPLRDLVRADGAADMLHAALRNFDLARICTIHGFCQHLLQTHGFECHRPFDTTLEPDLRELRRQACVDFWREHLLPLPGAGGARIRALLRPEQLERLAALPFLAQNPQIVPRIPRPDTTAAEGLFGDAYLQAQRLWNAHHEDIRVQLLEHRGLKANMGKPDMLTARLAAAEQYLRSGGTAGLDIPAELEKLTPQYMADMTRKNATPPEHPFFEAIAELLSAHAHLLDRIGQLATHLRHAFLTTLEADLDRRKHALNIEGFDDLLRTTRRALDNPTPVGIVRERYRAALIDEFQDTDSLQYGIFSRLFDTPKHSLFLIGDPKQAIYSFRGADLHTYLLAARECDRRTTLGANYRSTPAMINAINRVFTHAPDPFATPGIIFRPVSWPGKPHPELTEHGAPLPALTIWQARADNGHPLNRTEQVPRICHAVAVEIARLLRGADQGVVRLGTAPLRPRDMAVLVDSHRQGAHMHAALTQAGVHAVLAHTSSIFDSAEALDILTLLRAMAEPGRQPLVRAALATVALGLDAEDLRKLDEHPESMDSWIEHLALGRSIWQRRGIMAAMRRLLAERDIRARLLGLPGGERRMTNFLHCLEVLHGREREVHATPRALVSWLARRIGRTGGEEQQLRLDSDRDAVRIVTIHKSKGLEYPVVFCPFLFRSASVDPDMALTHEDGLVLDLGSEDLPRRLENARDENNAELVRLAYVALTRASCRCLVVWGRWNGSESSALARIFHGHRSTSGEALSWKTITDQDVRDDLDDLAGPDIEVRDLPSEPAITRYQSPVPAPDLAARPWSRVLGPTFGVSSFSGLTRGTPHATAPGLDEADTPGDLSSTLSMAGFPRGATAGSCLHHILEHIDFTQRDSIPVAVAQGLAAYGFPPRWEEVLQANLNAVREADLGGFCLADARDAVPEMEFLFPLRPLTRERLGEVYRQWSPVLPETLPTRMDHLRFEPQQGFLTGFMDLVFRHRERYYLLDWKSNWIGPTPAHYTPEALHASVAESWYFLQYHLYCLALDRLLALRLDNYAHASHFGGVYYIYLRGVDPDHPGCGIHVDRPDQAFLAALGRLLIPDQEHR